MDWILSVFILNLFVRVFYYANPAGQKYSGNDSANQHKTILYGIQEAVGQHNSYDQDTAEGLKLQASPSGQLIQLG